MKTCTTILTLFAFLCIKTFAQTSLIPKPVFKTGKELGQPFQKKQLPPVLLQLRENIIGAAMHTADIDMTVNNLGVGTRNAQGNNTRGNQPSTSASPNVGSTQGIGYTAPATSVFHLTKDINVATSSSPTNYSLSNYFDQHFAVLNNVNYFWANDGIHGYELWRSDGTATGTYMVKDIVPGQGSSGTSELVVANNKIFFQSGGPTQLWTSDGTEAGTQLVTTIPNNSGNHLQFFFAAGNNIFFVNTTSGSIFNQLWKSDGTAAGTALVYDAGTYNPGWGISHLAYANGIVYFTNATYANGYELWRTDGTPGGTHIVRDINPSNYDFYEEGPDNLTTYNNQLYFTESDGVNRKLWVADALGNTASPASGYNDVTFPSTLWFLFANIPYTVSNNIMYLTGYAPSTGTEMYRYDPVNGEVLLKEITAGSASTVFTLYGTSVDVNNIYYFAVQTADNKYQLWASRGKPNSTQLVKQFNNGESFYGFFNANGTLLFQATDQANGTELWKSDGTNTGTTILKDIYPGPLSSMPGTFTTCNNKILFSAYGGPAGYELWSTNLTVAGTKQLKDINKTTTDGSYAGSNFQGIAATSSGVFFSAYQNEYGSELFQSDGTSAGTTLFKEINPGESGSSPRFFLNKNNFTYFIATGPDENGTANLGIYKSDGTPGGTIRAASCPGYTERYCVTDNGLIFYTIYNFQTYTNELWRSDGTVAGTYVIAQGLSADTYPVANGNLAFFAGGDPVNGYELWKSDGTAVGTQLLKDINPGLYSSSPFSLFSYNGNVFFGAFDGINTTFWRSNGTPNGTVKVQNVNPAYTNYIFINDNYCVSNNTLYFVGTDATYGTELWKTTGTTNSTKPVKDIIPGAGSSYPNYLRDVNGTLFFGAYDANYIPSLWVSNGSNAGTKFVKNVSLYNPTVAGGKLYFINFDSLWVSAGTAASTRTVKDAGLAGIQYFQQLTGSGNKLFIGAYSYQYGNELYEGDVATGAFTAVSNDAAVAVTKFDAAIYPNPVKNTAQLSVTGDVKKLSISINDINGKNVWQQNFSNTAQLTLPAEKLSSGIYFVTINNGTATKVIKLVKQ